MILKEKKMKKVVSLVLVVLLIMSVSASALAGTASIAPGKSRYKTYNISSSPVYNLTAAGRAGDKITVRLDLYDNTVNSTNENAHWKKSYQGTFTINSGATYFVIKPKDFKFVKGRTPKARLKFSAPSGNKGSVDVIYP